MKIAVEQFCLLFALFLAAYITLLFSPSSSAANTNKKPLQGHIEQKRKYKPIKHTVIKTGSAYSINRPYNPDNPPPIDNKIHPVSSNAR